MILQTHQSNCWAKLEGAPLGKVVWMENRKGKRHAGEADWYAAVWVSEGRRTCLRVWTWYEWHRRRQNRRSRWPHIVRAMPARLQQRCG